MPDVSTIGESIGGDGFVLRCRGDVRLHCEARDCTPTSKKGRALLAILAAEQRPLSRVRLVDLLWSDRQEEQARASLRTLLADLKEQFGNRFGELLIVDRERVALGPAVRSDLADPALGPAPAELFGGLDHLDPELDDWLRTERERWANGAGQTAAASVAPVGGKSKPRRVAIAMLLAVGLALVILAVSVLLLRGDRPREQSIAILPVQGIASEQQALFSEYLLDGIRSDLGTANAVRVIGKESSRQFAEARFDPRTLHDRFGIDLVLTASIRALGGQDRLVARVVDARSGSELWTANYEIGPDRLVRSRDEIAEDLGNRVRETLSIETKGSNARWTQGRVGARLAEARRLLHANRPAQAIEARAIFLELATTDPDNVVALAGLAEATMAASDHPNVGGTLPLADARRQARAYALRAIRLAPDSAAGYGALGASHLETAQAIAPLERAVAIEPSNYLYRLRLARAYEYHDRYAEEFREMKAAARLEPLLVEPVLGLAVAGSFIGAMDEVRAIVRHFTAAAPAARQSDTAYVNAFLAYVLDDYGACARTMRGSSTALADPVQRNLLVWCLDLIGGHEEALALVRSEDSLRRYGYARDIDSLRRKAEELGPEFWRRNSESVGAAEMLAAAGHQAFLVALFDRSYNSVEEFDREGGRMTLDPQSLLASMQFVGRHADAGKLRGMLLRNARRQGRHVGLRPWSLLNSASAAMAGGDRERAIELLEGCFPQCIQANFLRDISETALFRPLNGNARFDALIRRYRRHINDQRRVAGLRPLSID